MTQKDGQVAWLHNAKDVIGKALNPCNPKKERPRLTVTEIKDILAHNQTAVNPEKLSALSASLGVSVRSLKRYGIGWEMNAFRLDDGAPVNGGAWCFPMFDCDPKAGIVPCGISLRWPDGCKNAITGSRNGLFIASDYDAIYADLADDPRPLLMVAPEGVSDCCAAADWGFRAVGRPGNASGADHIVKLLALYEVHQDIIIIGDRDEPKPVPNGLPRFPGIEGALNVCRAIIDKGHRVRFALPPEPYKDVRAWKSGGATCADVCDWIMRAPDVTPKWLKAADAKMQKKKQAVARAAVS